jgi:hypothetical protein
LTSCVLVVSVGIIVFFFWDFREQFAEFNLRVKNRLANHRIFSAFLVSDFLRYI